MARVLASEDDYMDCLYAYRQETWIVPKRFKGNSAAMDFIPELLVFEIIKQYLEKKHKFDFIQKDRRRVSVDQVETAYFIDEPEPKRLLVQGQRIRENIYGFPATNHQHDITYMVRDQIW